MGTFLIDKLLQTVVSRKASDLHITVGQPPVLRIDGRMKKLETKVLEPEDTVALMKSIAPERCQQELQEVGGADFGFAFGDLARFRVSIFKQRGHVAMVLRQIPGEVVELRRPGNAAGVERPCLAAARAGPGHRADRQRQDDHAGRDDRLPQRHLRPPHHHDRGPDRVLPPRTRNRRSTSGRSASTCPVLPRPFAADCGRTRT